MYNVDGPHTSYTAFANHPNFLLFTMHVYEMAIFIRLRIAFKTGIPC